MNTVVTSREDILKAAKALALSEGMPPLTMREVARSGGIAVGSIYNYFSTKDDLTIAVVAEVWREIFHPALSEAEPAGFLELVERMLASIHDAVKAYPGFFAKHASAIANKEKGRAAMEGYFRHMHTVLLRALQNDPAIRKETWNAGFTPEDFAGFTLDFLRADLMLGRERGAFLTALIRRCVYQEAGDTQE